MAIVRLQKHHIYLLEQLLDGSDDLNPHFLHLFTILRDHVVTRLNGAAAIGIGSCHPKTGEFGMGLKPRVDQSGKYRAMRRIQADNSNPDRKSTRLNSSHVASSYAVSCL